MTGEKQNSYFKSIQSEVKFIKQSDLTDFTDKVRKIKIVYRFMERVVNYDTLVQLFEAGFKKNIRIDLEIHTEGKMSGYRLFSGKMSSIKHNLMFQEPDATSPDDPTYITLPYLQSFHNQYTLLMEDIR